MCFCKEETAKHPSYNGFRLPKITFHCFKGISAVTSLICRMEVKNVVKQDNTSNFSITKHRLKFPLLMPAKYNAILSTDQKAGSFEVKITPEDKSVETRTKCTLQLEEMFLMG